MVAVDVIGDMKKGPNYIKAALTELGLSWNAKDPPTEDVVLQKLKDAEQELIDAKVQLDKIKELEQDALELIGIREDNVSNLKALIHQAEIEEYKWLNRGKNLKFY